MSHSDRRAELERQSAMLVGLEFAVLAGIYLADWTHHIYLSKIPYLFALAWLSLRLRGLRWGDVGFAWFHNWPTTEAFGVMAGFGIEVVELFVLSPCLQSFLKKCPICPHLIACGGTSSGSRALSRSHGRCSRSEKSSSFVAIS